jgi:hypothetical protein
MTRALLLIAALGVGSAGARAYDAVGRVYPGTGHHASRGKYCWPYHPSEAAVPQKHGYGYFPTMWRDWHENAYLIFSEPEKTCVELPQKQPRRERREELPAPNQELAEPEPQDEAPPPPLEFRPPSEMPGGPEPSPTPAAPGVPEEAPAETTPPAEEPALPNLPETFPGVPEDTPTLPDGPSGRPMSRTPRPTIRSSDYEGPVLEQPAQPLPATRPARRISLQSSVREDLTLQALRRGFAGDSRVQPASAALPIEDSAPLGRSGQHSPRHKIDHSVSRASHVSPASQSGSVSHAAYDLSEAAGVNRAVGYEARVGGRAMAPAVPARDNPLRYGQPIGGARGAAGNPLRR